MINVSSYWPTPPVGAGVTKHFDNGLVEAIVAAPDGGAFLEEWTNNVWQDTWHYVVDPKRGVLEDYDIYPGKTTRMASGKEIIWGNKQNIGDVIGAQCEIAPSAPLGIGAQYGWQQVQFMALLPEFDTPAGPFSNVLQIEYWQYWTSMGAPGGQISSGAIIWLAQGLGFIKQEWTKNSALTGFGVELQSYAVA